MKLIQKQKKNLHEEEEPCKFSCKIQIDLQTFEFIKYLTLPVTFSHNHPHNLRPCSSLQNRSIQNISHNIKNDINNGKSVLNAVEENIVNEKSIW